VGAEWSLITEDETGRITSCTAYLQGSRIIYTHLGTL
jgi:hypothetical protein